MHGGTCIYRREVKFWDPVKTINCESICLVRSCWSRTKVGVSKTIRYRRSPNSKQYRQEFGRLCCQTLERNSSFWVLGGVWSQDWNLKELTEGHHQEWSLRLNLSQHGKAYQTRTWSWLTDGEIFLNSMGGGAWPFLVGEATCLVNSDNGRDFCWFFANAN